MDKLEILPMKKEKQDYTYSQSQQISMQTGLIGYLRADMDTNGKGFFSSWNDFRKDIKTEAFKTEFDDVINSLRDDGNFLSDRSTLFHFCFAGKATAFKNDFEDFGIRVNTGDYAYMMRLNPKKGVYNIYCYCYKRDLLDRHLDQASKGIRFIDRNYNELFRIPDSDKIRVAYPDGTTIDYTCRYIDDYHTQIGNNLYHICEFAEKMEAQKAEVVPLRSSLPERCYSQLLDTGNIVILKRGETGYYKSDIPFQDRAEARRIVAEANEKLGVSKAQMEAMQAGSMFGFACKAADPQNYDDSGHLKKSSKNRGVER